FYPGAAVINKEPVPGEKKVLYVVQVDASDVIAFYKISLSAGGWQVAIPGKWDTYGSSWDVSALWTDPAQPLPWQLSLGLDVERTMRGHTLVTVYYSRDPNLDNVPLYPEAEQVQEEQEQIIEQLPFYSIHVTTTVITKTYRTAAGLQEIESFYNSSLLDHGWSFYDESIPHDEGGPRFVEQQPGNLSSPEGLSFAGAVLDPVEQVYRRVDLQITTSDENAGSRLVQLRFRLPLNRSPGPR
ncbi:MAG TPA: hypothetical protein VFR15_05230, partial [Chloroflexia bacterium]|nr:hypothetical protein [Chloroflexia bacterium]